MTKDELEAALWPLIRTVNPGICITRPEVTTLYTTLIRLGFKQHEADDLVAGLPIYTDQPRLVRILDAARKKWKANQ